MPDCNKQHTASFGLINNSSGTVVVGWIQGLSDLPKLPAEYSRDTGALSLPDAPNPRQSSKWDDLCQQKGILIAATHGSIAVKVKNQQGDDHDFRQDIDHSPPGQYHANFLFVLDDTHALNLEGEVAPGFRLRRATELPFIEEASST